MPSCSVFVTRSGQHQQQLILSPPSLHGCVSGPDMLSKHACMQVFCDMKLINTRDKISGKKERKPKTALCRTKTPQAHINCAAKNTKRTGFISHSDWLQLEYENNRPRNALRVASLRTRTH